MELSPYEDLFQVEIWFQSNTAISIIDVIFSGKWLLLE